MPLFRQGNEAFRESNPSSARVVLRACRQKLQNLNVMAFPHEVVRQETIHCEPEPLAEQFRCVAAIGRLSRSRLASHSGRNTGHRTWQHLHCALQFRDKFPRFRAKLAARHFWGFR